MRPRFPRRAGTKDPLVHGEQKLGEGIGRLRMPFDAETLSRTQRRRPGMAQRNGSVCLSSSGRSQRKLRAQSPERVSGEAQRTRSRTRRRQQSSAAQLKGIFVLRRGRAEEAEHAERETVPESAVFCASWLILQVPRNRLPHHGNSFRSRVYPA